MGDCAFCGYEKYREKIAPETEHFYVMPSVGQVSLMGSHMLIITKAHESCFGVLDEKRLEELAYINQAVRKHIFREQNMPSISFEHGIIGQTIPHAHMHALPLVGDLPMDESLHLATRVQLSSVKELPELFRTKGVYFYYQNNAGQEFGFHFSQYMRLLAAEAAGTPERGDWKKWTADPDHKREDEELIRQSVERFRTLKL